MGEGVSKTAKKVPTSFMDGPKGQKKLVCRLYMGSISKLGQYLFEVAFEFYIPRMSQNFIPEIIISSEMKIRKNLALIFK